MQYFGGGKKMPSMKELGLNAILSYGFVSNASYTISVGIAWFATSKKTGIFVFYYTLDCCNAVYQRCRYIFGIGITVNHVLFIVRGVGHKTTGKNT